MHIFTVLFSSIVLFNGLFCVFCLPIGDPFVHGLNPRNFVLVPGPTDDIEFRELVPRVKAGKSDGGERKKPTKNPYGQGRDPVKRKKWLAEYAANGGTEYNNLHKRLMYWEERKVPAKIYEAQAALDLYFKRAKNAMATSTVPGAGGNRSGRMLQDSTHPTTAPVAGPSRLRSPSHEGSASSGSIEAHNTDHGSRGASPMGPQTIHQHLWHKNGDINWDNWLENHPSPPHPSSPHATVPHDDPHSHDISTHAHTMGPLEIHQHLWDENDNIKWANWLEEPYA